MKSNQVLTLIDTGTTIKIMSHNLDEQVEKSEFILLKNALSYIGMVSLEPTTPVNVMTIVNDDTGFKFMCCHMDGTTSSGFSTATLNFLMAAVSLAEKKLKKKIEQYSKPMQGWDRD